MIEVYTWPTPNGHKIHIMLEETGLEYEVRRLHGVMEKRLSEASYFAGSEYSIADIAIFPWLRASERNGIDWAEFPKVKKWFDGIGARPAVQRALKVLADAQTTPPGQYDPKAREILFGATQY